MIFFTGAISFYLFKWCYNLKMKKDKKAITYNGLIAKWTNEFHFPAHKYGQCIFDVVGNKIYHAPLKVSLLMSETLKVVINHVLFRISVILIVVLSIFEIDWNEVVFVCFGGRVFYRYPIVDQKKKSKTKRYLSSLSCIDIYYNTKNERIFLSMCGRKKIYVKCISKVIFSKDIKGGAFFSLSYKIRLI